MVIKNLLLRQKEQGPLPPSSLTKESSSGRDRCDHFEHIHWFDHFDQGYQQHSYQRDRCDHFDRGYQQHRYQWGSTLSLGYYPKLTSNHCPFHEQNLHPNTFLPFLDEVDSKNDSWLPAVVGWKKDDEHFEAELLWWLWRGKCYNDGWWLGRGPKVKNGRINK